MPFLAQLPLMAATSVSSFDILARLSFIARPSFHSVKIRRLLAHAKMTTLPPVATALSILVYIEENQGFKYTVLPGMA